MTIETLYDCPRAHPHSSHVGCLKVRDVKIRRLPPIPKKQQAVCDLSNWQLLLTVAVQLGVPTSSAQVSGNVGALQVAAQEMESGGK